MDLISRQAAIEPKAISEWKKEFREYVDSLDITRDDWKGIIEYINEIPSAQPEHTETHSCDSERTETHDWIPVTERMPNHELAIVQYSDGDFDLLKFPTAYRRKDIVAWMSMPEPYKEGQYD